MNIEFDCRFVIEHYLVITIIISIITITLINTIILMTIMAILIIAIIRELDCAKVKVCVVLIWQNWRKKTWISGKSNYFWRYVEEDGVFTPYRKSKIIFCKFSIDHQKYFFLNIYFLCYLWLCIGTFYLKLYLVFRLSTIWVRAIFWGLLKQPKLPVCIVYF